MGHIHFAKGLPDQQGVISGMRQDCNVLVYVHMPTAIEAGFEFFESANGVILCPGDEHGLLPTRLFAKVVHKKGNKHKGSVDFKKTSEASGNIEITGANDEKLSKSSAK